MIKKRCPLMLYLCFFVSKRSESHGVAKKESTEPKLSFCTEVFDCKSFRTEVSDCKVVLPVIRRTPELTNTAQHPPHEP